MIIVYWYLVIGLLLGCCAAYWFVYQFGWEYLYKDFKENTKDEEVFDFSFNQFKTVFCVIVPVLFSVTWLYWVVYIAKKFWK